MVSGTPGSNLEVAMVSQVTSPPLPSPNLNTFSPNMELLANINETKHKRNSIFFINERRHLITHPHYKKSEKS